MQKPAIQLAQRLQKDISSWIEGRYLWFTISLCKDPKAIESHWQKQFCVLLPTWTFLILVASACTSCYSFVLQM